MQDGLAVRTRAAKVSYLGIDMFALLSVIRTAVFVAIVAVGYVIPSAKAEGISLARIPHIYDVSIDPAKPDHLILATPKGLYRLTPEIEMQPLLDDTHDVTGLVVSDTGKFLLASGKKEGKSFGVLFSADFGKSWTPQFDIDDDSPALRLMKVTGKKGRLLAVDKSLMGSDDAGKTWSVIADIPANSLSLAASRKNAKVLLAATGGGLLASGDGGETWLDIPVGPDGKPASMVARDGRDRPWAFIVGSGLYTQSKNGEWELMTVAKQFDGALIHLTGLKSKPDSLIAITQYMKILSSADKGKTWTPFGKQ